MPAQTDWRFCLKCNALVFDGDANKGHCAFGGSHEPEGFAFVLPHDVPDDAFHPETAEGGWRFCHLCNAMFFDGLPDKGQCPGNSLILPSPAGQTLDPARDVPHAGVQIDPFSQTAHLQTSGSQAGVHTGSSEGGGPAPQRPKGQALKRRGHEAAGFNFVVPHDVPATNTAQESWRFCRLCNALFFDGFLEDKGRCQAANGGGHQAAGFNYVLPHDLPSSLDFDRNPIEFREGIAAGGSAHLTFRQDGSYTFFGHFHDSGSIEYNVSMVWAVKDSQNYAYTIPHSAHINGTFESGSRDDDWRIDSHHDSIANNWVSLAAGSTDHVEASASGDLTGLTNLALAGVGFALGVAGVGLGIASLPKG